jgi:phosphatidylinositol dimannoside acyltransferase
VRDLPGYLLYRALSGLFGLLPEVAMRRTGEALGWALSFVVPRRRRLAERHMRRVLGPGADATRAARDMFRSYGRYWAEVFWVRPRRKAEIVDHTSVANVEAVYAARDKGNGIILALPHLGNWEAAGARAEQLGIPVLAVAEALPNRRIVDWFVACRNALGMDVVVHGKGTRVTPRLASHLRAGGTVALLADRDLKGTGVPVEFFGETTTLPAGPVALAERTGATLLPVGCYFDDGRGHAFEVFDAIDIPDLPTREARVAAGTQALARILEEIIRKAPEQWHLLQPNWPSDRAGAEPPP